MDAKKTGSLITSLRKENRMTQKAVAENLHVSEQAVSKWERGVGLPDISVINQLAKLLGVSAREILSGEIASNEEDTGNMKKTKFYVCPECGNIITSTGRVELSCCGKTVKQLEPKKIAEAEADHIPEIEEAEGEIYIHMEHEMSKEHFISFFAYITCDKMFLHKLYPEQNAEVRFQRKGHGSLLWYCSLHGLYLKQI